ncbi:MAG: VWA domain-containing protein, partial [Bdellovibrionales bacterium]|nr:VWA domain-containing protein [Bdellovibrionales bacterium]
LDRGRLMRFSAAKTGFIALFGLLFTFLAGGCRQAGFKVSLVEKSPGASTVQPVTQPTPPLDNEGSFVMWDDGGVPGFTFESTCKVGAKFSEQLEMPGSSSMGASSKASNIIILLDTSGSMRDEMVKLGNALPQFIGDLSSRLGSSQHRIVLHSDAQFTDQAGNPKILSFPNYFQHNDYVHSYNKILKIEEGLGLLRRPSRAITGGPIPEGRLIMDPGTIFHYLVITDEPETIPNECMPSTVRDLPFFEIFSTDWGAYEECLVRRYRQTVGAFMQDKSLQHRFHSIHSKTPDSSLWKMMNEGGRPYVKLTQTFGGKSYDIQNTDWDQMLAQFGNTVIQESAGVFGELRRCAFSPLKILKAEIYQETGGMGMSAPLAAQDFEFTAGTEYSPARVRLKAGVMTAKGFDATKAYTIKLETELMAN